MIPEVGIYRINIGERFYIGSSMAMHNRWKKHRFGMKNNRHENIFVQNAYNKHRIAEFELLCVCDESELVALEQKYIDANFDNPNCMNLSPTANSVKGIKRTAEQKEAQRRRGVSPQFREAANHFARNRPPETIEKIRQNMIGNVVKNETRNKIRESVGRLTWDDVCQIRLDWAMGNVTCKELAEKYKVCRSNISQIVNRKRWVVV